MLLGENGLLNKVMDATEEYSKAEIKEKIELLLSEYAINKATGENSDFERFLTKNLQVGVSRNEHGTYSFILGEWQVITSEKNVISIEKFKLDVDKTYPNVASMKTDTGLKDGQLVQTEGYWDKQYGGSAYYDIVSNTSLTVDDGKCIQLNNGLYAKLHPINNTVTVNQFGAYGDGKHDDAKAIETALNAGYGNVSLESNGKYKQSTQIRIESSNLILLGNQATIFNVEDYQSQSGADYHIYIIGNEEKWCDNITIINLNVESIKGADISEIQVGAKYASNVTIEDCNLTIRAEDNHKTTGITNIWFHTAWKNINIINNNILNESQNDAGGSIWFYNQLENADTIVVQKNDIRLMCKDEMINIWRR